MSDEPVGHDPDEEFPELPEDSFGEAPSYNLHLKAALMSGPIGLGCCRDMFLLATVDLHTTPVVLPAFLDHLPEPADTAAVYPAWMSPFLTEQRRELTAEAVERVRNIRDHRLSETAIPHLRLHCLKTLIKGIFLRSGYCQSPQISYHLEIPLLDPDLTKAFQAAAARLKVPFKYCRRHGSPLAYLKSRTGVRRFMQVLELYEETLAMDDLSATRDLLGLVNRQVNFETANIRKSISASERFVEQIRQLLERADQDFWTDALRDLARFRLEHPFDSLEKLGQHCRPPLTKSAVNHRLRRIATLYQALFHPGSGPASEDVE